jgi:diguanylate cyclase (GGDEF)-like protein
MGMKPTQCLKALGRAHTYDLRQNECLRTGLLLGLIVSILLLACEVLFTGSGGRNLFRGVRASPFLFIFFAHPLLFGLVFGAMGTIKQDLERLHERDMRMWSGLAMTDPLTGLYNRRYVEEELKNLLHRAERTGEPVSVVFFDLDHFKQVNQKQGHRGGDLTLKMVAEALQTVLRQGEILGRYGGDEFLLIVAADLPYAANLVERAVAAVMLWTRLSLSAGVARSRDDGTTPEELIAVADSRLAKVQANHHAEQSLARSSSA